MSEFTERPTISILQVVLRPDSKNHFVDWQAELNAAITGFEGFVSLEFLLSSDDRFDWAIVERFTNPNSGSVWRSSVRYQELMTELRAMAEEDGIRETLEGETDLKSGVTVVIITQVNPKEEKAFREWSARIHQIEAKFPGFRGVYIQSPDNQGQNWITLLQFDSPENLDRWLKSAERQEILNESTHFISSLETHRMVSPYAGWFSSIAKTGELPSVWKQTMIVLLVLFPIIMMELKYLSPLTGRLGTPLSTFIGNAVSVILIAFPMMPLAIYCLGWWLSPSTNRGREQTIIGSLIVCILYLLEIVFFNNFF